VVAIEDLSQPVPYHRIGELDRSHFLSAAEMGDMRGKAHALLAAGDYNVGIARGDLLGSKSDGPET
jgi:hypothetical protein